MTVILVEDEALIRLYLSVALTRRGVTVVAETGYGRQAVDLIQVHSPSVVFLDIQLADDLDGISIARSLDPENGPAVILMSAYPVNLSDLEGSIPNLVTFVPKPVTEQDIDEVLRMIQSGTRPR